MKDQFRSRQRGISIITMLFVVGVLAYVGVMGAQVFPTLLEYQAAEKAAQKATEASTVGEVRKMFDKAAAIDDIRSITGKDLEVTKEGDKVVVKFAYNKEIHMFGPAYLVMKYVGRSK